MLQLSFSQISLTLYFLLCGLCLVRSQWVMYPKANPPPAQTRVIYYPQPVQTQPYQPQVLQPYQPYPTPQNPPPNYFPNINNNNNINGNNNGLQQNQAPVVATSRGRVGGKVILSEKGFRMFAYLGVPYAERPNLFQRSEQKRPWTGVYDARELGPGCASGSKRPGSNQVTLSNRTSTDCLYLKILVPAQRNTPLPVLFWPHGGGYSAGSNGDYDIPVQGDNIVSKGVIIAQPSYRTGAMGFWSSGSPDAPGNYGMWDVFNALQFVRREIANFGGDPNRITLMGQGAGGISCDAMTLSPLTRGLYSKAAMLSGSIFQTNVNVRPQENEGVFRAFATAANCDDLRNSQWNSGRRREIVRCLRSKTPQQILQAQSDANLDGSLVWHPIVDGNGGLLPVSLEQLARQRPVFPVLMGATNQETAWDLLVTQSFATRRLDIPPTINRLNSREEVLRQCDSLVSEATFSNPNTVRELCKIQFGNQEDQSQNSLGRDQYFWLDKVIQAGSSFTYFAPIHKDLSFHLQNGNRQAYLYSLEYYRQQAGPWWQLVKSFHNLDIAYIEHFFPRDIYRFQFDNRDRYIQDLLTGMITNFAKTGNPSMTTGNQPVRWEPLSLPQGFNYLSLDMPATMKPYFHMDDVIFWNQLAPLGASGNSSVPAFPVPRFPGNPTPLPFGLGPVRPPNPPPIGRPVRPTFPPTNPQFPNPQFPNPPPPVYPPLTNPPVFPPVNPNQPPNSGNPNYPNPRQPLFPGNIFPPPTAQPNFPNVGPGPVIPPGNQNQNLTLDQVLNNGLEFIRNFLPPIINSIGITHKLDEQFVKHQVSQFSMEWNPNVKLSSACGRGLSAQPHALDSSTFGFHSIQNWDT